MTENRTFGWVQNPGSLKKLKSVVALFNRKTTANSEMISIKLPMLLKLKLISKQDYDDFIVELSKENVEIKYSKLKGKGSSKKGRKNAICTGIVQAALEGQQEKIYTDENNNLITIKKPYVDDWTAEGFIRWAVSCGLIDYKRDNDTCVITKLGKELSMSVDDSDEEYELFSKALLSYPPVIRILSLLEQAGEQTKFELGSKLGFIGELGFTSMPQDAFLCDFCEARDIKERSAVRANEEGDSDKYARGIASWCKQMGWVTSCTRNRTEIYKGKVYTDKLQVYSISRKGEKALLKSKGNSSNPRLPKIIMFEMLASNKTKGSQYLRFVRAHLINIISKSWKTLEQIKETLKAYDLDVDNNAIQDHINGLMSIGLEIKCENEKYRLIDKVDKLDIPAKTECIKDSVITLKDRIRNRLICLDHKYLSLVDLAYSDSSNKRKKNADAREFEIQTADLFTKELSFKGQRLGDSNKPDVIISYDNNGTIIDNKSYQDGFNINRTCADEMGRYINENKLRDPSLNSTEWWNNFDGDVDTFTFLFVTSFLKGHFEEQLEYISNANDGIKGAAINVENLLYFSEGVKSNRLSCEDFYNNFNNKEIIYE